MTVVRDIVFDLQTLQQNHKKPMAKDEAYKECQQDPAYLEHKEAKEQSKKDLLAQAMQSEYTTLLGENMLIGFRDMQDIDLMADLQRQVYPLYDQLKEKGGLEKVKQHLSYVANKQEAYSKRNIAKYLYTAIKQYLNI